MKKILFDDLYSWSVFNETRQIDFNGHLWCRPEGNILIDPVPMIASDLAQLDALGGAAWIVLTNKDHEREAASLRQRTGARLAVHGADADALEAKPDRLLEDGEELVPGLSVIHLEHGKSPGEIALYWPDKRLVLSGDLVVGAPMGKFSLLMDDKLADPPAAALQLRKLLALDFDALIVGDGHSILRDARQRLCECLEERADICINRVNIDDIDWVASHRPPGYSYDAKDIDPLIGARHLGYQLIRLPQGQSICPIHFHYYGEELFYVAAGTCIMRTPRGAWPVRQGDFIAFPPGPASAHKFTNEAVEPCILFALGVHLPHEVCEYPDSNKINVAAKRRSGHGIFRLDAAVDYWDGE